MMFPWFSYVFPRHLWWHLPRKSWKIMRPRFSYGFPITFVFSMIFPWFSNVFPWFCLPRRSLDLLFSCDLRNVIGLASVINACGKPQEMGRGCIDTWLFFLAIEWNFMVILRWFNGDLMGLWYGDLMVISWDFMEYNVNFMGFWEYYRI